jgi:hypothetical protein
MQVAGNHKVRKKLRKRISTMRWDWTYTAGGHVQWQFRDRLVWSVTNGEDLRRRAVKSERVRGKVKRRIREKEKIAHLCVPKNRENTRPAPACYALATFYTRVMHRRRDIGARKWEGATISSDRHKHAPSTECRLYSLHGSSNGGGGNGGGDVTVVVLCGVVRCRRLPHSSLIAHRSDN